MNYCVPDFETDEDYAFLAPSSGLTRSMKSPFGEEIMELLWQNGQVVMQSQNQRPLNKRSQIGDAVIPAERSAPAPAREIRSEEEPTPHHLFMQEDEMASWLHMDYSFDRDLYSDLIYPAPSAPFAPLPRTATIQEARIPLPPQAAASRPPIPLPRRPDAECSERVQNFVHFSRPMVRTESGPARESTVVDSCETPAAAAAPESMASHVAGSTVQVSGVNVGCGSMSGTAAAGGGRETGTYEMTSSPDGSGASASATAEPVHKPPPLTAEDRKRKAREVDDTECPSEDVEFESPDAKKQNRGSTSVKKSRAAEVHNLSERRRRDRINEKMRALQELIPRCNKSDKASMLDEAIEYLKSLQLQVQMMSMGCSMVPMMFPGVQQYMPPMGMAMGMGMGMGMEMGMSRPMLPFPSVLAGSALPTPAAAAHLGSRFPVPAFHMPPVHLPGPTSQSDAINSHGTQNPYQPRMLNFPGAYQQYLGIHQAQLPLPQQNQAMMQPASRPSSSREVENHQNLQSG